MKYKIRLEETEEGYAIWVPGLPGCWSQGETEREAIVNIKDAIQTYLETKVILKSADKSFTQGWAEAISNRVLPIEQLFEIAGHGDYSKDRHEWLDNQDMDPVIKRIREKRQTSRKAK